MLARDIMTSAVVSVAPDTPARRIAQLLVDKGISAVPVVDAAGAPIGMVSEGDLIGRDEADRESRRDWWLTLLAEGEVVNADFLASLQAPERRARDVMAGPLVTVAEDTEASEIARLLTAHRIKRVPVVRDGRIVGIVSRADLLRALAAEAPAPPPRHGDRGGLLDALAGLDQRFLHRRPAERTPAAAPPHGAAEADLLAAKFRALADDFAQQRVRQRSDTGHEAALQRQRTVGELINQHISDDFWRGLVHQAREAAQHGQSEFMLLRFPSQLCSDGGRAINVSEPDWPATLRGEAAELYLRWKRDLRPHGFHLVARVLDFPGGMPGDIGLSLVWGI